MKTDQQPYKILLIEDNLGDIVLIREYLEEQFISPDIEIARTYGEAASILSGSKQSFDVLLLDLSLPDKNGEELINGILSYSRTCCPIIILTGYTDIDFSIRSIALGISDYLLKDELTAGMLHKSILYSIERWASKIQLQESESRFSYFFNLSPQPSWVYEVSTLQFINVNEAALKDYGYAKEEFLELNPIELYVPEERAAVEKKIKAIDDRKLFFSGNFRHLKKSGEEIEVEIFSTFLVVDGKPCRLSVAINVTEKNKAELRLTQAIIKTQEEERYGIGSELHDNICQILAGSMLVLGTIKNSLQEKDALILSQGIGNIRMASEEIRNLSHRLAPAFFDEMNFKDSLSQLITSLNPEGKFEIELTVDKEVSNMVLKKDLQLNLYRILQEQLNNILKHSMASGIKVSISIVSGKLMFEIADNGVGFDEENASKGIGFANMNRRAKLFSGNFKAASSPGNGCRITITIPSALCHN
ncbi:MAG: PAS domain S-box protein [Ferruginibacter sp.]